MSEVMTGRRSVSPPQSVRAALDLAIRRFGSCAHAYTIGRNEEFVRYALAAGVSSAGSLTSLDSLDFDVALLAGDLQPCGDLLPATLAEEKQCAMVVEVLDVLVSSNGLHVERDLGKGTHEVLSMSVPAVLCISEHAGCSKYVSRFRRQRINLPNDHTTVSMADELWDSEAVPWESVRPRAKPDAAKATMGLATDRMLDVIGAGRAASENVANQHVIEADPAVCAGHLLRYLSHHGFITKRDSKLSAVRRDETSAPTVNNSPGDQPCIPSGLNGNRGPYSIKGRWNGLQRRPRPWAGKVSPQ
jgi:electron transfer flavoprotein alpha/beta subunit